MHVLTRMVRPLPLLGAYPYESHMAPDITFEPLSYQVQGGPKLTVGIKVALCN